MKLGLFEAIILLVLAGLLEAGVRIVAPQSLTHDAPDLWQPDEAIGWRHRPDVRVSINTGDRDVDICTDGEGDRVSCAGGPAPACRRKVLVVGDSYSEAVAIPFEQTAWHLLEVETGACHEVAAVGGYGPSQYRKLVQDRLSVPGAGIDLVLVNLYVGNDFSPKVGEIPPARDVQRRPLRLLPGGFRERDLWDWFYPFNQWLESRSHAYVGLRAAIRRFLARGMDLGVWGLPNSLRPSWLTEEAIEPAVSQVRAIAEYANEGHIPVLVTLIPDRVQVLDPDGTETLASFPEYRGDYDPDLSTKRILPRLEEIRGAHVVDLLPALRSKASREHWGKLDRHFSPEGHRLWFELIRGKVQELLDGSRARPDRAAASGHSEASGAAR